MERDQIKKALDYLRKKDPNNPTLQSYEKRLRSLTGASEKSAKGSIELYDHYKDNFSSAGQKAKQAKNKMSITDLKGNRQSKGYEKEIKRREEESSPRLSVYQQRQSELKKKFGIVTKGDITYSQAQKMAREQKEKEQKSKKKDNNDGFWDNVKGFLKGEKVTDGVSLKGGFKIKFRDTQEGDFDTTMNKIGKVREGEKPTKVDRFIGRAANSASLGLPKELAKRTKDELTLNSYYNDRKIGKGGGADLIADGLGYIAPGAAFVKGARLTKAGANAGAKGIQKALQLGKEGAAVGGAMGGAEVGIREALNGKDTDWKDNAKHISFGTATGAIADPLIHGAGKAIGKGFEKASEKSMKSLMPNEKEFADAVIQNKGNTLKPNIKNRPGRPQPETQPKVEPIDIEPSNNLFEAITTKKEKEIPLIKVSPNEHTPMPNNYDSVQHIDNLINREAKPTSKNPIGQRIKEFMDRTYYNMFDDAYGLARLDKANGKNVRDSDSAIATAHRSRGASSKAQQELEQGFYDANGQKVGNSFTDILQSSKNPDKLETYLVAKGILDYDARGMVALKTDGLNQLELSNAATRQMELENPNIIQEAGQFYAYLKNQRNILKEGGIFNDAQIKQMEKNNPNYVPMERLMDEGIENFIPGKEGLKKRFANVGNPIKKRTGSERQIISPFETTVKRQYVYNNMAERNKAGMAVLNHLRNMPENNIFGNIVDMEENTALKLMKDADDIANQTDKEIPEKVNELFRAKDGDNNIIYVYENGNKYKIQIKDKMLFDSMMSLDSKSLPAWMNVVNLPVRMLRAGITLSPDFALRNFLRDQLTTGITSQKGYIPFYDAVLGASEIIKGRKGNSELINAYTRNGGNMSVLQNIDRANTIKTIRELKGNVPMMEKLKKLANDPSLLLEPLRIIGEFSEMSTRIGHMKRSVKKGESMEQATYNARSTMDFNRAGAWGRQINQMTAFFNASLQGLDVLARSFKDQPIKTARNLSLYVVAPTVALYHLNKDQQWFKDLPEEERDKNWFINTGQEIIKVPKPFEAGILFGASVERALDKYYNNNGDEFDGFIGEVASTFVPELIPTAVKPLFEVYTNQNFFTGNAIDSMGDKMLPAKDRYNAYNSQFAIKASDIFSKIKPNTEISPKDIDHLIRGYTGTLGSSINEGVDALLGITNPNIPERPSRGVQTTPFIRSLVVRNLEGNNKPTNDFYERGV
jgi:hypothetical protein